MLHEAICVADVSQGLAIPREMDYDFGLADGALVAADTVFSSYPEPQPLGRECFAMPSSAVRVLVVEDEPLFAKQLELALLKLGHEPVGPAADARIAMALHRTETVDVALLDINLRGGADGVELAGQLLAHRPIPLIFLTSRADEATFARVQHLGAAAYLIKPVAPDALNRAMVLAINNFAAANSTDNEVPEVLPQPASGSPSDVLFVKENGLLEKVRLSDVQCVAADGKFCTLTLTERTVQVRMALRELVRYLPADRFVQIQRSYFVNLDHVERLDSARHLVQVGKQVLPVGRLHYDELMRRLRTIG